MGPIALFDKSFLQSLNLDESLWFDHFFLCVIAPIFYAETLADLAKQPTKKGPAEAAVRIIASKFPEGSGSPCLNHNELCVQNVLGNYVPLTGQIPMPGGREVQSGNRHGVVFDLAPEVAAFQRWQKQEFMDIERLHARAWRQSLTELDLGRMAQSFRALGVDGKRCKTLEQARDLARLIVDGSDNPYERFKLALIFFNVPEHLHRAILERWNSRSRAPLSQYAPYAAFVLTVELFFQLAIAANLISADRPSNRTDIAYLFYLPFCMVFVSSDLLHQKCASLFMRDDQQFIWGPDLKAGLSQVDRYFRGLPEETKELGIMKFARYPPTEGEYFLAGVFDAHTPGWRKHAAEPRLEIDKEAERKIVKELTAFSKGRSVESDDIGAGGESHETMSITRRIPHRKGSWWILPKNFEVKDTPDE